MSGVWSLALNRRPDANVSGRIVGPKQGVESMLRSVLVVAGSICDVTFALHHALSPAATMWVVGASLMAAAAGCVLTAATLSRRLAGLDLPAVREQ
ncbi:MAG: hypothetical protein WD176_01000 [Pirellulales bacterium]